jgi:hypothetical protein
MFKRRFIRLNAALLLELLEFLEDRLRELIPGSPTIGVILFVKEGVHMGAIEVKADSAPLLASVKFYDAEGNETPADDVPAWTSSDEAVATVTASEDGLSAEVAVGGPGASQIEVRSTEANTGAEVVAAGTVTVLPGDAVVGSVEFEESPPTGGNGGEEPPAEEVPA